VVLLLKNKMISTIETKSCGNTFIPISYKPQQRQQTQSPSTQPSDEYIVVPQCILAYEIQKNDLEKFDMPEVGGASGAAKRMRRWLEEQDKGDYLVEYKQGYEREQHWYILAKDVEELKYDRVRNLSSEVREARHTYTRILNYKEHKTSKVKPDEIPDPEFFIFLESRRKKELESEDSSSQENGEDDAEEEEELM